VAALVSEAGQGNVQLNDDGDTYGLPLPKAKRLE
jgi:hypothetical protein